MSTIYGVLVSRGEYDSSFEEFIAFYTSQEVANEHKEKAEDFQKTHTTSSEGNPYALGNEFNDCNFRVVPIPLLDFVEEYLLGDRGYWYEEED